MADDSPRRRSAAVSRAADIHGTDTEAEFSTPALFALFQSSIALIPFGFALGALAGARYSSGFCFWACVLAAASLVWSSLIGLGGALRILAGLPYVVLIYKDRLLVQKGHSVQDIPWSDIDAVYVCSQAPHDPAMVSYEAGKPDGVWVTTEVPLAKFDREWTEVRTRGGEVVRLPSSIMNYEELSRAVQSRVSSRVYPRARAELQAGRAVTFGPIQLRPNELAIENLVIPWDKHGCSWSGGGEFFTNSPTGPYQFPKVRTEQIPNLAVVLSLILDIRRDRLKPTNRGG